MFCWCHWAGGNSGQRARDSGGPLRLATLSSSLVMAFSIAATIDVAQSSPGTTGNLVAASTPGTRPGLSRSRPAIDARAPTQSRSGLSRHQRPTSQSYRNLLRFRNFGHDRQLYSYSDRYRSSGGTRINIYTDGRTVSPGGSSVLAPRRMPGSGLCRDSASRLCVIPGANFHSIELICDTDSQRFKTGDVSYARRLSCRQGRMSSVWIERPGPSPGEGEGLGIRFDPTRCPVPSPCDTSDENPDLKE
jgi:hypothetical protein